MKGFIVCNFRLARTIENFVFHFLVFIFRLFCSAALTLGFRKMIYFELNDNMKYLFFQDRTLVFKEMICSAVNDYVIYFLFQDHPT